MDLIILGVGLLAFLHGVRDVLQYYGKKNFFTQFMHLIDNKKMEIPSAIISFAAAILLFWVGFL